MRQESHHYCNEIPVSINRIHLKIHKSDKDSIPITSPLVKDFIL